MKTPQPAGTVVDETRRRRWVDRFGSYRAGVDNIAIASWLAQFDESDRDLAARVLDVVEYYGQSHIYAAYRQTLTGLAGWSKTASKRRGKWAFCAMSRTAGESGDAMLHNFRVANGLGNRQYDSLFFTRSELFRLPNLPESDPARFGADDVVVLLDDFSGTGGQVCNAWNDPATSFGALLAGVGTVYLLVVAASRGAVKRIKEETDIEPVPAHFLDNADSVFASECAHFTTAEQKRLVHYCQRADRHRPKGHGDCGFVVVFQHRTPNNSIPILHASHAAWLGLFPRH